MDHVCEMEEGKAWRGGPGAHVWVRDGLPLHLNCHKCTAARFSRTVKSPPWHMNPGMTRWKEEPWEQVQDTESGKLALAQQGRGAGGRKHAGNYAHLEVQLLASAANTSLARAQLTEVLRGAGNNVLAQLHGHSMQGGGVEPTRQ